VKRFTDFSVVLAVDAKYLPQLLASSLTWRLFHPWLWHRPWVVCWDRDSITREHLYQIDQHLRRGYTGHFQVEYVQWPPDRVDGYESQRHKMLSAFAFVPGWSVSTPYFLKIDTDAICLGDSAWPLDQWFDGNPCWVAPAWNYSKPGNQPAQLDDWADKIPELAKFPRLNIACEPGAKRCYHPRMCSWLSFYSTQWVKQLAGYCTGYALPVPSQDGTMWYVQERRRDPCLKVNFKKWNWTNISKLPALQQEVRRILTEAKGSPT
jgi:hypothetical protein